ncbi:MAG: MFS transporter, partial [Dehalococcoidia bacterium]
MNIVGEESAAARRDRGVTVWLVILCLGFQAISFGGIGLFLPEIREDLDISFTEAGSLSAAVTLVYALMQIPVGYWTDRFGPKRLFLVGMVGTNILTLAFGFVDTYWQALANQAVSGLFRALVFLPGLMLVASWFPPDRRATAMGLFMAGVFSSSFLLSIAGPFAVEEFGWRPLFVTLSAAGLVASFVYFRFAKERPRSAGQQQVSIVEALKLFRYRIMWTVAAIQYVRLAVFTGILFWLPTLLVEEKGQSLQIAGLVLALRWALTAPSNFVGGYISDRLRNPPLVIGVSLVMLAITTLLFVNVDDIALLILVIAVNAVFVQLYLGPLFAVPVEILGPRTAGVASGFSNFFANMGG